jgi:protein-S-isoprenylcysteine O-methyltransferase Ste14
MKRGSVAVVIAPSIVTIVLGGVVLFASAGTFEILSFWLYLMIFVAFCAVATFVIEPDLAQERMRPGGKPLSASMMAATIVLPLLHLAIAGLDRGRYHWSDRVPPALQLAALFLFALAGSIFLWAMQVNRFFSSVPRIQRDRGHVIIDGGPYRFVRHPGYTAALVMALTSGVALGSWFAAALGWVGVPLLLRRTIIEDQLLRTELPGYVDYAKRVHYRLISGIW